MFNYATYNPTTGIIGVCTSDLEGAELNKDENFSEVIEIIDKENFDSSTCKVENGQIVIDNNLYIEELSVIIRQERNERLKETDWRFRSDLNPSQAWIDYCQNLRDIPLQAEFPTNITWPTRPE